MGRRPRGPRAASPGFDVTLKDTWTPAAIASRTARSALPESTSPAAQRLQEAHVGCEFKKPASSAQTLTTSAKGQRRRCFQLARRRDEPSEVATFPESGIPNRGNLTRSHQPAYRDGAAQCGSSGLSPLKCQVSAGRSSATSRRTAPKGWLTASSARVSCCRDLTPSLR